MCWRERWEPDGTTNELPFVYENSDYRSVITPRDLRCSLKEAADSESAGS